MDQNEGEEVSKGEPIVEVETDKVTQELYSEHDGVLEKVFFKEEEDVKIGDVIAKVNITETTRKTITSKKNKNNENIIVKNEITDEKLNLELDPTAIKRSGIGNKISLIDLKEFSENLSFTPAAKRIIKEKNIDTSTLTPSLGTDRVNKSDVINNRFNNLDNKNDYTLSSNNEHADIEKPLSKLRQSIASRLKQAQKYSRNANYF